MRSAGSFEQGFFSGCYHTGIKPVVPSVRSHHIPSFGEDLMVKVTGFCCRLRHLARAQRQGSTLSRMLNFHTPISSPETAMFMGVSIFEETSPPIGRLPFRACALGGFAADACPFLGHTIT